MAPKISEFIRAHPVTTFYLLAFAISWAGWVPPLAAARGCAFFASPLWKAALVLPALGPAGAAVLVVRLAREPGGVGPWWRTLFRWRVGLRWIVIAVVAPPALLWAASAVGLVWSHGAPVARPPLSVSGLLVFGLMSLLANPCEEVGWRGYALPRLQARYHAVVATLVVGLMWAAWHVPIFLLPAGRISMAAIPFLPWCVDLLARSFIMTWLFNRSGRSVLVASLFHLAINMSGAIMGTIYYPALAAVEIVVAIGLMSLDRTARAGADAVSDR